MSVALASLISCPSALAWVFCKRVRGVRAGNVTTSHVMEKIVKLISLHKKDEEFNIYIYI